MVEEVYADVEQRLNPQGIACSCEAVALEAYGSLVDDDVVVQEVCLCNGSVEDTARQLALHASQFLCCFLASYVNVEFCLKRNLADLLDVHDLAHLEVLGVDNTVHVARLAIEVEVEVQVTEFGEYCAMKILTPAVDVEMTMIVYVSQHAHLSLHLQVDGLGKVVYQLFLYAVASRELDIPEVELKLLLLGYVNHLALSSEGEALVVIGHADIVQTEVVELALCVNGEVEGSGEVS